MRRLPIFICLYGFIGGCSWFHKTPEEPVNQEENSNAALEESLNNLDATELDPTEAAGSENGGKPAVTLAEESPAESTPVSENPAPVEEPPPAPEAEPAATTMVPSEAPALAANPASDVEPAPVVASEMPPAPPVAADAPTGSASVAVSPEDASRVVRYVKEDQTPVYSAPKEDATQVRTLLRGTSLMVLVKGDWAEIIPGQHIHVAALSEKPMTYTQGAQAWQVRESHPATKKE